MRSFIWITYGGGTKTVANGIDTFIRSPYVRISESDISSSDPDSLSVGQDGFALLIFSLNESLFGIPSTFIQEVCENLTTEKLPFITNRLCSGFISLRGTTAPLLDVRAYLQIDAPSADLRTRVVVISHDRLVTAISVDQIHGVMSCIPTEEAVRGTLSLPTVRIVSNDKTATVLDPVVLSSLLEEGFA